VSHLEIALAGRGVTGHEPYLRIGATIDCYRVDPCGVSALIAISRRQNDFSHSAVIAFRGLDYVIEISSVQQ
jgi:hypothetical protein